MTPGSIGSTVGPPSEPSAVYDGPTEITADGTVIDGMVIEGCLAIRANSVTIRNSVIQCGDRFPVESRGASGLVVERTRISCSGESWAAFHVEDTQFSLNGLEVTNCGDPLYISGWMGSSRITNTVMWHPVLGAGAHYDGIQIGSSVPVDGSLLVEGNWFAADGPGCCYNAAIFVTDGNLDVTIRNNWIDGRYGYYPVRCYTTSRCRVEGNVSGPIVEHFVLAASSNPVVVRCNVLENGSPIPDEHYVTDGGSFVFEPC